MNRKKRITVMLFCGVFLCLLFSSAFQQSGVSGSAAADGETGKKYITQGTAALDSLKEASLEGTLQVRTGASSCSISRLKTNLLRLTMLQGLLLLFFTGIFQWRVLRRMFGLFLDSSLYIPARFLWDLMICRKKDGKKRMEAAESDSIIKVHSI